VKLQLFFWVLIFISGMGPDIDAGEIYQWIDQDGVQHFTNGPPPPDAQIVEGLSETQSDEPPAYTGPPEREDTGAVEGGEDGPTDREDTGAVEGGENAPADREDTGAVEGGEDGPTDREDYWRRRGWGNGPTDRKDTGAVEGEKNKPSDRRQN